MKITVHTSHYKLAEKIVELLKAHDHLSFEQVWVKAKGPAPAATEADDASPTPQGAVCVWW